MSVEATLHVEHEKQFPKIMAKVAESHGIRFTSDEIHGMGIIATACGVADDVIDQCHDPEARKIIAENAFAYLLGSERLSIPRDSKVGNAYVEAMENLKGLSESLPESRLKLFVSFLCIWNQLSERRRNEESLEDSLKTRKCDLGFTASVYLIATSEETRCHANYRNYVKDFKRMVRMAGMLDDIFDLARDYGDGIVAIKPTVGNKVKMLYEGFQMGIRSIGLAMDFELVKEVFKIMLREYRRRGNNNWDQYTISNNKRGTITETAGIELVDKSLGYIEEITI